MSDRDSDRTSARKGGASTKDGREVRRIVHVDMDAFYAAIEQRDFPDKYAGEPIAEGGCPVREGRFARRRHPARIAGPTFRCPRWYDIGHDRNSVLALH